MDDLDTHSRCEDVSQTDSTDIPGSIGPLSRSLV